MDEVHEITKITVANLMALEDNRFDFFPNRVYARAFLRDYANFLALDSAAMLERYEQEWNVVPAAEPTPKPRVSSWRVFAHVVLAVVIVGGLCAAGYLGWKYCGEQVRRMPSRAVREEPVATLPRPAPMPEPTPRAMSPPPKPLPVPSQGLELEVTALRTVWVGIIGDGERLFWGTLPAGKTMIFRAKSRIRIRAGMAGAVSLKLNGERIPPLGSLRVVGDRTFTAPMR